MSEVRSVHTLLGEFASLLNQHGIGSPEELAFVEQHKANAELVELANTARWLKEVLSSGAWSRGRSPAKAGTQPTEENQLVAMLSRAGVGFGLRLDHNPGGTAVQIEAEGHDDDWFVTEFAFDAAGKLTGVVTYEGEIG